MTPSKGHKDVIGNFEYFTRNGDLFKAPLDAHLDSRSGFRLGARFVCTSACTDRALDLERAAAGLSVEPATV